MVLKSWTAVVRKKGVLEIHMSTRLKLKGVSDVDSNPKTHVVVKQLQAPAFPGLCKSYTEQNGG